MRTNMGCGPLTVKYLVLIFNFVFFMSGLALIIIGGVVQGFFLEYVQFFENRYETPSIGIIILGVIILVISFFGCCGATKENVCMLNTFAVLMGLIFLCEIAAGIAVGVLRSDVEEVVQKGMKETMAQYGSVDLDTKAWDSLQQRYRCCGVQNYTDWIEHNKTIPESCCLKVATNCTQTVNAGNADKFIYINGCYNSLYQSAIRNMAAIAGGAVTLAFVQVVGIWMACCLVKAVKDKYEVL